MVILRTSVDEKDTKAHENVIKKLLSETAATVKEIKVMGKKRLAYPIQKQSEGVYLLVNIEGEAVVASALASQSKLHPDILRYMLVVHA